jgi:hypothetical protein
MACEGRSCFRGIGRRDAEQAALSDAAGIAELERKIGQLTMENDFLKKPWRISGITQTALSGPVWGMLRYVRGLRDALQGF